MESYRLNLQNVSSASERMEALCEFIEFWIGPRKSDYGEPHEAVENQPLPMPLQRLYKFAGRWPNLEDEPNVYVVPALSHQDNLVALDRLKYTDEDKVVFLGEDQDVWNCRTLYRKGLELVTEPDLESRLLCALVGLLPKESTERSELVRRAVSRQGSLVAQATAAIMGILRSRR